MGGDSEILFPLWNGNRILGKIPEPEINQNTYTKNPYKMNRVQSICILIVLFDFRF